MKMLSNFKAVLFAVLALALSMIGFSAHAAGPDFSTLTGAIDFSTVIIAIMAVAAALISVYIAWRGAKFVLAAVRGG